MAQNISAPTLTFIPSASSQPTKSLPEKVEQLEQMMKDYLKAFDPSAIGVEIVGACRVTTTRAEGASMQIMTISMYIQESDTTSPPPSSPEP